MRQSTGCFPAAVAPLNTFIGGQVPISTSSASQTHPRHVRGRPRGGLGRFSGGDGGGTSAVVNTRDCSHHHDTRRIANPPAPGRGRVLRAAFPRIGGGQVGRGVAGAPRIGSTANSLGVAGRSDDQPRMRRHINIAPRAAAAAAGVAVGLAAERDGTAWRDGTGDVTVRRNCICHATKLTTGRIPS